MTTTTDSKPEAPAKASEVVMASAVVGMPVLLDKETIKSDQDVIRTSLVKTDQAIHSNAVQCMLHAKKHGDTSLMRRLLVDIITADTGYRRQGLIGWMREFSPMELGSVKDGSPIKLTGTFNGARKAWNIEEANRTPFWKIAKLKETIERPVFRSGLVGRLQSALRFRNNLIANTLIEDGKVKGPKDITKPFYDGIRLEELDQNFDKIAEIVQSMLSVDDQTQIARESRAAAAKADLATAEAAAR